MAKLVSIEGRVRPAEARQNVVEKLEAWLERARRGELVGIGLAGVQFDGSTLTEFSATDYFHPLHSAVHVLAYRMMSESEHTDV
jgi:hypothetical protein